MKKVLEIIGSTIGIIVIIGLVIWWMVFQWNLCMDNNLGVWYCIQHISN